MVNGKQSILFSSHGRKMGLLCGICLLPIFFLFAHFGQPERGFAAMCALGVLISVIYVKKNLLKRTSFIITMSILFVIHIIIVMLFPFSAFHFTRVLAFPISLLDLLLILALVRLVAGATGSAD